MAPAAAHPMLANFVDYLVSGGSPEDDSLLAEIQITGDRVGLAGRTIAEAYGSLEGCACSDWSTWMDASLSGRTGTRCSPKATG